MTFYVSKNIYATHCLRFSMPIFLIVIAACSDFVDIDPPKNKLSTENVFKDDVTATSAMRGIYFKYGSDTGFGKGDIGGINAATACLSDELQGYRFTSVELFFNELTPTFIIPGNWNSIYNLVYQVNALLEGVGESEGLTDEVKKQLTGEALFFRALSYFYLVNLWGDVPFTLTSDYNVNKSLSRTGTTIIYEQIIEDLLEAESLLIDDYSFSGLERTRVNRFSANALLARVYLYQEEWALAESEASKVIDATGLFELEPLADVFKSTSQEAILQIPQGRDQNFDTYEGSFYVPRTGSLASFTSTFMSESLLTSFEVNDQRAIEWTDSVTISTDIFGHPHKYKIRRRSDYDPPFMEYSTVLRLAEQYLIRAEARAMQNKITEAQADINVIRARAGLSNTTAASQIDLVNAVLQERRVELFTEGHRWFDLIRLGRADAVLGPLKGTTWQSTDALWPLPETDMIANPNLRPQNPGY